MRGTRSAHTHTVGTNHVQPYVFLHNTTSQDSQRLRLSALAQAGSGYKQVRPYHL